VNPKARSLLIAIFTAAAMCRSVFAADVTLSQAIQEPLEKSNGNLTSDLRQAYLDWSEYTVLASLAADKQIIPAGCLKEIDSDTTLRDAVFGAIYPPDPSILQNYARLRQALGPEFMRKYKSLVVGVAVMQRKKEAEDYDPNDPDTVPDAGVENPAPPQNDPLVGGIAQFMKTSNTSALDIYQDPAVRQKLATWLTQHQIDSNFVPQDNPSKRLTNDLKQAMITLGQRPAHRSPMPDEATWLKYLATIYESTPSLSPVHKPGKDNKADKGISEMKWPLFPMNQAPWPLLMPLARCIPLDEAHYIWDKFNGLHGENRLHTYGPYKKEPAVIPLELQPSAWSWRAWPDLIVHGGVCVTMSIIAVEAQNSLCIPSVHAAQPHHANLISFRNDDGKWYAAIEQAFAGGPNVTHAAWPFKEGAGVAPHLLKAADAGAEYHLGLALGMNVGLRQYIDTRIAVNIYESLSPADKSAIGVKLLTQAVQTNPYNPQPWYLLVQQGHPLPISASPASDEEDSARPVESATRKYWRTLADYQSQLIQKQNDSLTVQTKTAAD
jgi:hypothetical protein